MNNHGNRYKHGLTGTSFYRVWSNMKTRCLNPRCIYYENYGGRGIKVCDSWLSFDNFMVDMLGSYRTGLTLDRIDNDYGYSKKNCRWVGRVEQANNRRNKRLITFGGVKKTLSQWAMYIGIKRSTLAQRFYVYKWNVSKCLEKGVHVG